MDSLLRFKDLERPQHLDGFLEFAVGAGGFESQETAAFQEDVIAVSMEYEALAVDFHGRDSFVPASSMRSGGIQNIRFIRRQRNTLDRVNTLVPPCITSVRTQSRSLSIPSKSLHTEDRKPGAVGFV